MNQQTLMLALFIALGAVLAAGIGLVTALSMSETALAAKGSGGGCGQGGCGGSLSNFDNIGEATDGFQTSGGGGGGSSSSGSGGHGGGLGGGEERRCGGGGGGSNQHGSVNTSCNR